VTEPAARFPVDVPGQEQSWPGATAAMDPVPDHGEDSHVGRDGLSGKRALMANAGFQMPRTGGIAQFPSEPLLAYAATKAALNNLRQGHPAGSARSARRGGARVRLPRVRRGELRLRDGARSHGRAARLLRPSAAYDTDPRRVRTAAASSPSRSAVVGQSMHLSVTDWP